jgi:hypothetical protein
LVVMFTTTTIMEERHVHTLLSAGDPKRNGALEIAFTNDRNHGFELITSTDGRPCSEHSRQVQSLVPLLSASRTPVATSRRSPTCVSSFRNSQALPNLSHLAERKVHIRLRVY